MDYIEIFSETTKPIDHASLLIGYRVGQIIQSMRLKTKPIGFLYGHEAKEGETPTHTINGVKYVGAVLPNIESIYTSEVRNNFPYAFIYYNPGAGGLYVLRCNSEEPGVRSKSNLALCPYDPNNKGQFMSAFWGEGEANSFGDPSEFAGAISRVTEGIIWTNFDLRYQGTNEVYFPKSPDPIPVYEKPKSESTYLTFASASPFTIATYNAARNWNGTLFYSTDTKNWSEWSGSAIVSAEHDGEQRIYMRGIENDAITHDATTPTHDSRWVLNGSDIACRGNIETLLDYPMVANGEHPSMAEDCYRYMFLNCANLTQAPSLPATELTTRCYYSMFEGCSGLTKIPALPATTLADDCYRYMFYNCTSLTQAPALPATTLACYCYYCMFEGCTNLAQIPALPATRLSDECYHYMFYGCSSLKLSTDSNNEYTTPYRIPYEDASQAVGTNSIADMFTETGGTFTGTPSINTVYYTSNTVV